MKARSRQHVRGRGSCRLEVLCMMADDDTHCRWSPSCWSCFTLSACMVPGFVSRCASRDLAAAARASPKCKNEASEVGGASPGAIRTGAGRSPHALAQMLSPPPILAGLGAGRPVRARVVDSSGRPAPSSVRYSECFSWFSSEDVSSKSLLSAGLLAPTGRDTCTPVPAAREPRRKSPFAGGHHGDIRPRALKFYARAELP